MPGRFGRAGGRFFRVKDEQRRIDRGLELYQNQYGTEVAWYFLEDVAPGGTVVNDVYDEGEITGGKKYNGPHRMPVMSARAQQGQDEVEEGGFITFDHVTLKLSYEQARRAGLDLDLIENRESHIHDRFVWRDRVFDVGAIQTAGHFDPTNRDTTIIVQATQVRPDELVDSPEFQAYYWG